MKHTASKLVRSLPVRYGVAVLGVLIVLLLKLHFASLGTGAPALLFFSAVMISAWYGGLGPGLLGTGLGALTIYCFFTRPGQASWDVAGVRTVVFLAEGTLISALCSALRMARKSRLDLAAIVESSNDAIFGASLDGTIVSWNAAAEATFGYRAAEVIGRPAFILATEDRRHEIVENIQKVNRGEMVDRLETIRLRKDGTAIPVSLSISPVRNEHGELVGASMIVRDITARKQAEQALRESQDRLAGVIESAMDAIITVDQDQRILLFNAAAETMFRCPAREAVGQPIDRFIPERHRTAHRGEVRKFGETSVTSRSMGRLGAICGLRADGEEFPAEASISHVEVGGRKLFTFIMRDITERRRAEETLRESEERFRIIADIAPVMIWTCGTDGRVNFLNARWLEFRGRALEQEIGDGWADGVHPDDQGARREVFGSAFEARQPFKMEFRLQRADGKYRWVLDMGVPRFTSEGNFAGYIGVGVDISEQKWTEDSLRGAYDELSSQAHKDKETLDMALDYLHQEIAARRKAQDALLKFRKARNN